MMKRKFEEPGAMAESRRELLRQLHELERAGPDRPPTAFGRRSVFGPTSPLPLDPQSRSQIHDVVINHLSEAMLVVSLDGVILERAVRRVGCSISAVATWGMCDWKPSVGDLLDRLAPLVRRLVGNGMVLLARAASTWEVLGLKP